VQAFHPLQFSLVPVSFRGGLGATVGQALNPLGDIGQFTENSVTGLYSMIQKSVESIVQIIGEIVKFVEDFTKAIFGAVSWQTVLNDLGSQFKSIANLLVILNPARYVQQLMLSSALTKHTFLELDHFLGGLVTNLTNLSDVGLRAIRGDAISKIELLKDALAALEVVAIIFGGPAAVGLILGVAIGNEVCMHQTMDKTACMAVFEILGAAVGGYVGDAIDNMTDEEIPQNQANTTVEDNIAQEPFSSYLSDSAQDYMIKKIADDATKVAVILCQADNWVGAKECSLLGKIAEDYIMSDEDQSFEDFMASESAKLGVAAILANAFPPGSKAHTALINAMPKPIPVGPGKPRTVVIGQATDKNGNPLFDKNGNPIMASTGGLATILLLGAAVVGGSMLT
jgi:hypothetical protein